MKFFDLFSGIGGFHLGMERAGHECVGACENDKYKNIVYKKRFPNTKIWGDARTVNPEELPDFEVLCAGFPCQAFSIAGRRRGFDDTRGTIFFEIARIAKEKRPRLLLLENVKGLLSHCKGKTYRTIRNTLDEMGYAVEWQLLNSKYFVPQNRERIIIIGHLRGECSREIFPVGEGMEGNIITRSKTQEKGKRIRNQITGSIQTSPNKGGATMIVGAIDANYHKGYGARSMIAIPVMAPDRKKKNQNGRIIKNIGDEMFTLTATDKHGVLIGWSKSTRSWGVEQRFKIGEANTLNTGEGCRNQSTCNYVIEKYRVRRLTPLECERLQCFPDNWTDEVSDTQRYRGTGDAVTVDVVNYVGDLL